MVVSNSVDSVDRVLPSVSADRSSVYRGVTLTHNGDTFVPVSVVGDVVLNKHVFKTRRVGFVDDVVRHSYDDDGVVSVNTGGITSFSAGVDGVDTATDDDASVVHKRIAFVSGDVRVTDGVVSDHAGGDTIVSACVDVGDAVVMNTGRGGTTTVDVDGCSVVPPVVDSCDVDQVLSTDTTSSGGG